MQHAASSMQALAALIRDWGAELGFRSVGISPAALPEAEPRLQEWLAAGRHGEMDYMARHGTARSRPAELLPGTRAVISVRLDYYASSLGGDLALLRDGARAYISRYALGRDYHKVLRRRLAALAERIQAHTPCQCRPFTDSAPVMEVALAAQAGNGWQGKHTLLLSREAGSLFFLGDIYTDLPLPPDPPGANHCGTCTACLDICPTGALLGPYTLDARRCISYLTIELKGPIPEELRPLLGNRVYGCDDCQLVCPWNRFARRTLEPDFTPRPPLADAPLVELFRWSETEFHTRLAGSAIHRIGHEQWRRNLAVALGNGPATDEARRELESARDDPSALVREHVGWALARLGGR